MDESEASIRRTLIISLVLAAAAGAGLLALRNVHLGAAFLGASVISAALRPWRLTRGALWGTSAVFFLAFICVIAVRAYAANGRSTLRPQLGNQLLDTGA